MTQVVSGAEENELGVPNYYASEVAPTVQLDSYTHVLLAKLFKRGSPPRPVDSPTFLLSFDTSNWPTEDGSENEPLELPMYMMARMPAISAMADAAVQDRVYDASSAFPFVGGGIMQFMDKEKVQRTLPVAVIKAHLLKLKEFVDAGDVLSFKNGDTNAAVDKEVMPFTDAAVDALLAYLAELRQTPLARPILPEMVSDLDELILFVNTMHSIGFTCAENALVGLLARLLKDGNTTQDFANAIGLREGTMPLKLPPDALVENYGPWNAAAVENYYNSAEHAQKCEKLFNRLQGIAEVTGARPASEAMGEDEARKRSRQDGPPQLAARAPTQDDDDDDDDDKDVADDDDDAGDRDME
jgi:hypothetical protein